MPRQKKVKLIGLGVPANLLKEFIDLSYKGNTSISPVGYEIDTPLSDSRVKVYTKPNSKEVIVVHRGSVGLQDWLDNAKFLVAGKVKSTKTYKMHRERHLKAVEKYGAENIIGIGHSRAGLYLQELQKEVPIKEIITYNKAVGFYDALRTNPAEQTDVKVKNDFVSLLSGLQKRPKKMVEIEATKNPLDLNKAHQPAELEKLGETFIGLKEDEKPMEGSGRAPSPKTLDQLKKILKTLEGKLEKINKGKVYKTTNKDKVSYDISYTKARIKNHETNGEDLIITKKAKYGNELPKKAKPYKAKPKKEPKKEEPKKEEPKKEEPKKEEPKKKEPKKKEDIKKEDFKDMWDYYSALWYIPNPNRPNKGARYNFYNDFNDNIIKLGSIENPRKTTHKGFEEITNKEALSILIELRERMENYLKTGDYGKYYTLAEVKKLLEMIEKPIEEHTKYLNKKKEPKKEEPKKEPKKEEPKKEEPKKEEPNKSKYKYSTILEEIDTPSFPVAIYQNKELKSWIDWLEKLIEKSKKKDEKIRRTDIFFTPESKQLINELFEFLTIDRDESVKKSILLIDNNFEELLKYFDFDDSFAGLPEYSKALNAKNSKKLGEAFGRTYKAYTEELKKEESKKEEPKKEEPKKEEPKKEEPKKEEPKIELPTPEPTPKKIEPLINKLESKIKEFEALGKKHGAVIYNGDGFAQVVAYIALLIEYESKCAIIGGKNLTHYSINSKLEFNTGFYSKAEKLSNDLLDCIKRGDKMIAIPLSLYFGSSTTGGHANLLIYRPYENTIERFEPYGELPDISADKTFNIVLKRMFEVEMKPYLKEYTPKFIEPNQVCPNIKGFQALEEQLGLLKQEGGGFCAMWSLFILELIFLNPTLSTKEIIQQGLTLSKSKPQYLRNVIRGYVLKIEKMLDSYVKKIGLNDGFNFKAPPDKLKNSKALFQEQLLNLLLSFGGSNSNIKELEESIKLQKLLLTKTNKEINIMAKIIFKSNFGVHLYKKWTTEDMIEFIMKEYLIPTAPKYKASYVDEIFKYFEEPKKEEPKPTPKKEEPKPTPTPKKEEPEKEEPKRGEAPFKGASKKHRNFELEFIFKDVKANLERINELKENRTGYMTQALNIINVLGEFDIALGKGDDWQKTQQINRLKKYYRSIFNGFIESNYPSEKRMSLSFIPLYDNELAELKTYLKKHDLKLPNLIDLFSEVKKYEADAAEARAKAKKEGGIFGWSDKEKADKAERKMLREEYYKTHNKQQNANYTFDKKARDKWKKEFYAKNTAPKAKEIVEAPKAEEDAEQEVTITEPIMEGSGYKKSYIEEIANPTNPMFAFKSALGVPMFIDPENEYLTIDEMYGGSAQDMLGMNCYDGKCFNPVWEKEKIKRQILSEYKIWYWPWGTPPAGHIRMPWLNAMVEERYKPVYDEFVRRRNVNIGLDANASKDDFGRQMFSNLTDALSYVPVLNLPTTIALSAASAVSDIKKEPVEPVEPIDTD